MQTEGEKNGRNVRRTKQKGFETASVCGQVGDVNHS